MSKLALEPEFSFSSGQVIRVLDGLAFERGAYPKVLRVDQGPELTSLAMLRWAAEHDVILQFSDPGKPTQNAHIESLNGRVRDELFKVNCYRNLAEVREAAVAWRHDYNRVPPHSSSAMCLQLSLRKHSIALSYNRRCPKFRSHVTPANIATGAARACMKRA